MAKPLGYRAFASIAALLALSAFAAEPAPESAPPAAENTASAPSTAAAAPVPEQQPLGPVPPVPGNSFAGVSDALRADVLLGLIALAKDKHGCSTPRVFDTRTRSPKGRVRLGPDGKLVSGTITEVWKADVCGTKRNFTVVLSPPGEGASGVAITERE